MGPITVKSPRLRQCLCQPHTTETCRPLTALLPEHIAPELPFLETEWAALASYGVTAQLLQDIWPFDETRHTFTIRQHVYKVAEWLEQALGGGTIDRESGHQQTLLQKTTAAVDATWRASPAADSDARLEGDWEAMFREWYPGFRALE